MLPAGDFPLFAGGFLISVLRLGFIAHSLIPKQTKQIDAAQRNAPEYWFYVRDSKKVGPESRQAILMASHSGFIKHDTLVWCKGMPQWAPAIETPLSALWPDTPPPLPGALAAGGWNEPPPLPRGTATPAGLDAELRDPPVGVFQEYLSFEGRIGRMSWLGRQLFGAMVIVALATVIEPYSKQISGVIFLFCLYFLLVTAAKRVHDFNASAWLAPIFLIPIICLALLILSGTYGPNKYGDEP